MRTTMPSTAYAAACSALTGPLTSRHIQKQLNGLDVVFRRGIALGQYTSLTGIVLMVIGTLGIMTISYRTIVGYPNLRSRLLDYLDALLRSRYNIERSIVGRFIHGTLEKIRFVQEKFMMAFYNPSRGSPYLALFFGGLGITTTGLIVWYGHSRLLQRTLACSQRLAGITEKLLH